MHLPHRHGTLSLSIHMHLTYPPTSDPTHLSEGELNGLITLPLQMVHEIHNDVVWIIHLILTSHQIISLLSEVDY